jgi:hypothetical protein
MKGQLQTWAYISKRSHLKSVGLLMEYVVENMLHKVSDEDVKKKELIQSMAGSKVVTTYFNEMLGDLYYDVPLFNGSSDTLRHRENGVLTLENFQNTGETVCIAGIKITGASCQDQSSPDCVLLHHFEGSWKV